MEKNTNNIAEKELKEIEELERGWRKLSEDINRNKKIDIRIYEAVFSKTYALLKRYYKEPRIEKVHINLIVNAFLFANTESKELDFLYRAALVLTERMLTCCIAAGEEEAPEGAEVYVLTMRREVHIDFNDVDESLRTLAAVLEEDYWGRQ